METQTRINPDMDTEIIYIEGWKGKDEISIYEGVKYFKIIEHRKNKESGKVYENIHTIPKENVEFLWEIIQEHCEIGQVYGYKLLVRKLLERKKFHEIEGVQLEQFMEAFNGGKNRARYYFPHLYFPLKCLEALGFIQYFGRGSISRIIDRRKI